MTDLQYVMNALSKAQNPMMDGSHQPDYRECARAIRRAQKDRQEMEKEVERLRSEDRKQDNPKSFALITTYIALLLLEQGYSPEATVNNHQDNPEIQAIHSGTTVFWWPLIVEEMKRLYNADSN